MSGRQLDPLDRQLLDRGRAALEAEPARQQEREQTHERHDHDHPGDDSGPVPRCDIEEPHPSELGELALMRVEHELPRMPEFELQDVPLALAEHHRVGELVGLQPRAGAIEIEEVAIDVQRVDKVELEGVDDVEPHLSPTTAGSGWRM